MTDISNSENPYSCWMVGAATDMAVRSSDITKVIGPIRYHITVQRTPPILPLIRIFLDDVGNDPGTVRRGGTGVEAVCAGLSRLDVYFLLSPNEHTGFPQTTRRSMMPPGPA